MSRTAARAMGFRRALTLVEMLCAVLVLGMILFALTGWVRSVRAAARHDLAVSILARLNQALDLYHHVEHAYPPDDGPNPAETAARLLRTHAACRDLLAGLHTQTPTGPWPDRFVDPWGTPLRYWGPLLAAARVRINGGRPVFVSAGPDRDFGEHRPAGLADNLASDDPRDLAATPR